MVMHSLKEYLIEQTNSSLAVETTENMVETVKASHNLCDEYDDDGNYTGDDPRVM